MKFRISKIELANGQIFYEGETSNGVFTPWEPIFRVESQSEAERTMSDAIASYKRITGQDIFKRQTIRTY